jgi:hypothetical protein
MLTAMITVVRTLRRNMKRTRTARSATRLRRNRISWRGRFHLAHQCLHPLRQGDDIGVRFLEDFDLDALAAIGTGDDLPFAMRALCAADVSHTHFAPFERGDDRVFDLRQIFELVQRAHEVLGPTLLDRAAGNVDVLLRHPIDHLLDRDSGPTQLFLFQKDVDLLLQPTLDAHGSDTFDRLERALHLQVGQTAQAAQSRLALECGTFAGEAELEHRIERRIEMQDERTPRLVRQEHGVELLQHVLRRLGHVAVPGELEDDVADLGTADAGELHEPADDTNLLLDRAADVVLHLFRGCAGILGAHGGRGVGELRHERHGKAPVGEEAEDDCGQEEHEDRDRPRGHEASHLRRLSRFIRRRGRVQGLSLLSAIRRCRWRSPAPRQPHPPRSPPRRAASRAHHASGPPDRQ